MKKVVISVRGDNNVRAFAKELEAYGFKTEQASSMTGTVVGTWIADVRDLEEIVGDKGRVEEQEE